MGSNTPAHLDPHEAPPQELKDVYKSWAGATSLTKERLQQGLLDTESLVSETSNKLITPDVLEEHFKEFLASSEAAGEFDIFESAISSNSQKLAIIQPTACEIKMIPGLIIFPSLLPPSVQRSLLSRLLHRDLSNSQNKTNVHLHHTLTYPPDQQSFFSLPPSTSHLPKDPSTHRPLTTRSILDKNLHWVTLGGQYDWTQKAYPASPPPDFPPDIGKLISSLFPDMKPEAAILNVYSPKDKLSLHRDVSEEVDRGLVSISLGCSCLFVIGLQDKSTGEIQHETILLRSGDVLYMSGESRYAWHGVPKIIPDSCPEYLESWPGKEFPEYEGWMSKRRINLNVRQMYE